MLLRLNVPAGTTGLLQHESLLPAPQLGVSPLQLGGPPHAVPLQTGAVAGQSAAVPQAPAELQVCT